MQSSNQWGRAFISGRIEVTEKLCRLDLAEDTHAGQTVERKSIVHGTHEENASYYAFSNCFTNT